MRRVARWFRRARPGERFVALLLVAVFAIGVALIVEGLWQKAGADGIALPGTAAPAPEQIRVGLPPGG